MSDDGPFQKHWVEIEPERLARYEAMFQWNPATAHFYDGAGVAAGQTIADFQGVQWMMADAATDLEAARGLADRSLEALEAKEQGSVLAAHAKKFASRVALARLGDCMQVMGANGAKSETVSSRHLGYAKLAHYLDGANEIQNVVISRDLFRRGSAN